MYAPKEGINEITFSELKMYETTINVLRKAHPNIVYLPTKRLESVLRYNYKLPDGEGG